jgi:hypothetical protein
MHSYCPVEDGEVEVSLLYDAILSVHVYHHELVTILPIVRLCLLSFYHRAHDMYMWHAPNQSWRETLNFRLIAHRVLYTRFN